MQPAELRVPSTWSEPTSRTRDPFFMTWARRCVTIPTYSLLCTLGLALSPALLVGAALTDVIRRTPWAALRALTFFLFYLCCEVLGVIASFGAWLAYALWVHRDAERWLRSNFALQCWWARTLWCGVLRIFQIRVHLEEDDCNRGPVIVFMRHASVGDTLLPAFFLGDRHQLRLRYVMKRELLWDPCLDIVGNRLPNYFVRRGSGESAREIAGVQQLMSGLGPQGGVLIYPEGTRFTPEKRARILDRFAQTGDRDALERARPLTHLLPPRLGGVLGLLECNEGADALFCAHVGFEGAASFRDVLRGSLVRRAISVRFWRVPFATIPKDRSERIEWLYTQWMEMDAWVGRRLAETVQNGQTNE